MIFLLSLFKIIKNLYDLCIFPVFRTYRNVHLKLGIFNLIFVSRSIFAFCFVHAENLTFFPVNDVNVEYNLLCCFVHCMWSTTLWFCSWRVEFNLLCGFVHGVWK